MTAQAQRLPLAQLAARAQARQQQGQVDADFVAEARGLSSEAISALKDEARLDPETRQVFEALEASQAAIVTDPYARRAWIRNEIIALASDESADPDEVVGLLFMARAKKARGADTLPLFLYQRREEAARWEHSLVLPNFDMADNGTFRCRGPQHFVAATSEDLPALKAMEALRELAATTLTERLEGEMVANIRRAAIQPALYLFKGASVWEKKDFDRRFQDEPGREGLKRLGRGLYRYFEFSRDEVFVAEDSKLSRRFVVVLDKLADNADAFFKDELEVETMMKDAINQNAEKRISVDQFLRGLPGIVGVICEDWRLDPKNTGTVYVLFERRDDGKWRWVIANPDAVNSLFNGPRLAYHEWTAKDLPKHLEALFRRSAVING